MLKLILYAAYITIIIAIEIFIHIKKENDAISFLGYVLAQTVTLMALVVSPIIVTLISNFLTN